MRIAYFDCFSGISGDMTIGAFLDAGLSMTSLTGGLAKLKLKGYRITKRAVRRGSLTGTKFDCVTDPRAHSHRSLKEIMALIDRSRLSGRVKAAAKGIFAAIGKAEAKVHGVNPRSDIRLHELGARLRQPT